MFSVQKGGCDHIHKYGSVDSGGDDGKVVKVKSLVEKPSRQEAKSDLAVLGRYIIEPTIFEIPEETPSKIGLEIQLPDCLITLAV